MADVLGPALPWDILREIAFICPGEICATLMRTCTFFYHEAAASILGHTIHLYNDSVVTRFLRFLRAGKKPRYPCVCHLALCFDRHSASPLSLDSAEALAAAIALMTQLVVVDIIREDTLGDWPAIGHAIASLPSLRRVFIEEVGPRSCQFLLSLQSVKLRSIKLDITDHEPEEERPVQPLISTPWLSLHPVQFFGRWSSTLTELQYHSPFLHAPQYTLSCYPEVYPMMRTLSIFQSGHVDLIPYIRAFLNLAHLGIDTESQLDSDDVHEYHTSNIVRSQREVQCRGPVSQHSGWQELVQFNGPLVDLYALALNCCISHMKIEDCIVDAHISLLSAVLADARPIHLNIGLIGPMDSLCSILQTQGASCLESLVVFFLIYQCTPHEDVASALVSTIVLGQGTLVYLSLS
ncbi:hypothetical protein C8Q74DRAFT_1371308 [Fomes fomentarius]|nr:hypothetical protein C8Q74DRAFT_1371308 [Fomes fomentarius]